MPAVEPIQEVKVRLVAGLDLAGRAEMELAMYIAVSVAFWYVTGALDALLHIVR